MLPDGAAGARAEPAGIGEVLGHYRLVREIGRGAMGAVYLAEHTRIERRAAVKVLLPELAANAELVERFFDEARASSLVTYAGSRSKHPGIVEVYDCGRHASGAPYIVMEYLEGESLGDALARVGSLAGDLPTLLHIGIQIANAMAAAHARAIVHRDLKPDNVFLTSQPILGRLLAVKILDFGIAKLLARGADGGRTAPGLVVGTPLYMSPEQCRGEPDVGPPSDVYSLGCILFQMACGRPPFVHHGSAELLVAHLSERPPAPRMVEARVPPDLETLILHMLAKAPQDRPRSMAEVEERLAEVETASAVSKTLPVPAGTAPARPTRRPAASGTDTRGRDGARAWGGWTSPDAGASRPLLAAPADRTRHRVAWIAAAGLAAVVLAAATTWSLAARPGRPARPDAPAAAAASVALPSTDPPPARVDAPVGMVRIEGGTFGMGSTDAERAAALAWCQAGRLPCRNEVLERESPLREVALSPFFLDRHEVTNAAFARWLEERAFAVEKGRFLRDEQGRLVADLHPARSGIALLGSGLGVREGQGERPVVQVSWFGADAYCRARGGRLPTEAEWEWAARGQERRRFPWGDASPRCGEVVFGRARGGCAGGGPEPVETARLDVTPAGIADLGGNVAEWVADRFEARYPACGAACRDPVVLPDDDDAHSPRVIRGGDWVQGADACRAAGRSRSDPGTAQANVGFRCARASSVTVRK